MRWTALALLVAIANVAALACGGDAFQEAEAGGEAGEGSGGAAGSGAAPTGGQPDDGGEAGTSSSSGSSGGGSGPAMGGAGGSGASGGSGEAGSATAGGGMGGSSGGVSVRQCTELTGRLRDFQPDIHPDFEPQNAKPSALDFFDAVEPGIVQYNVDVATWKPLYAGPPAGTNTTIGPEYFPSWFTDLAGVNVGLEYSIPLERSEGVDSFESSPFLPIDDGASCPTTPQVPCLLGNSTNYQAHNYAMTFELHAHFDYRFGNQFFEFEGDDDAWLFVNGELAIDLGGIHPSEVRRVLMSDLGLAPGPTRIDFFWAERHVTQSHFRIETNLQFLDCGVPAP